MNHVVLHRLAGDEEGKGEGFKGDGDCDEGGERQRGNGDSGKSDGDGDNGGRRAMAMAMATKRVMVTATRVGEGGGQQNGQWRWRQERWQQRQGWKQGKQQHPMASVLYLSASSTRDLVLLNDLSLDERGTRTNINIISRPPKSFTFSPSCDAYSRCTFSDSIDRTGSSVL